MVTQIEPLDILLKYLQELLRKMMSYNFTDYLLTLEIFEHLAKKNALDLTAPASDALLKNRKNAWVQLAGHPGAFAPAGPHTIWKKRLAKENTETRVYHQLLGENLQQIAPKFYREVEYNQDFFIEMEDLLQHFQDPHVMDCKMGTRTFLESEVKNPALRKDLYDKMIKLDPNEPSDEEHQNQAITKLRYMQFREHYSSTSTLGFRIEAIRASGDPVTTDLKQLKQRAEVQSQLAKFVHFNHIVRNKFVTRLKDIRHRIESSHFFLKHEIIGSSLLFLFDNDNKAGVWMIDFAKTIHRPDLSLTHRSPWQLGNHSDGYLTGLDNIIQMYEDIACFSDNDTAQANFLGHSSHATLPTSQTKPLHSRTANTHDQTNALDSRTQHL